MKQPDVSSTPLPVVFTSQPTKMIALAALSLTSATLIISEAKAAQGAETRTVQPIVFISQPKASEFVVGDKLLNWETLLGERLDIVKTSLKQRSSTSTHTCDAGPSCDTD